MFATNMDDSGVDEILIPILKCYPTYILGWTEYSLPFLLRVAGPTTVMCVESSSKSMLDASLTQPSLVGNQPNWLQSQL